MAGTLRSYLRKRDFSITREPRGGKGSKAGQLVFVIQKHAASHLHYDFRLELGGTLKSWAVPKGPSLDPTVKRMAVHVEDHPMAYASFEGEIPKGQYGGGTVIVWDNGTWEPVGDPQAGYAAGKLKFRLHGKKLTGGWTLVRMHGRATERQDPWLLIKERDDAARSASQYSVVDAEPKSVLSDRTIPDPAAAAPRKTAAKSRLAHSDASAKASASAEADAGPLAHPGPKARRTRSAEPASKSSYAGPPTLSALPAGAKKVALPKTLSPQLATLVAQAPDDAGWSYEIKFDGYRLLARVDGDDVRLVTRNGNDWSSRMKGLVDAVRALGMGSAWLDGEIVVAGASGAPDFNLLQNAFDSTRTETIQYYLFDLPYYAGHDLRGLPLEQRRAVLRSLLDAAPGDGRIRFSEDFDTADAGDLLRNACRMKLEGVIGKRADSPYVSRRSPAWIKLKCTQRQEFVVGGWTDPKGSRTGIGSLLLGIHDEAGDLHFAGGVGSGFDETALATVKKALVAIGRKTMPFAEKPPGVKAHWVEPELVAEVSFGEWTPDGRVRHAVFHGLRDDKPAKAIIRERPAAAKQVNAAAEAEAVAPHEATPRRGRTKAEPKRSATKMAPTASSAASTAADAKPARSKPSSGETEVRGIRISHPERVIDASTGITKLELVDYYLEVARLILPHLAGRPVSLVRAPAGIGGHLFFQKHAAALKIPDLKTLDRSIAPDLEAMVEVDSFTALIGAAQANVVEFHTWNATTRDTARPDRIVFDLDPGEGVAWKQMQEAAELTRSLLDQLGLASFLKTSGGKGLHVVAPIAPKDDWDTVKALSKAIVEHMATIIPERFVAKSGPKNRVGRIFVDYLRNGFGATTACAWSARARPGLGISVPCAWRELGQLNGGAHWTIRTAAERIEEKADAWHDYAKKARQTTGKAMKVLGVGPGA